MTRYAPNEQLPDCWNWGKPCFPQGYGILYTAPRKFSPAHRWVYEHLIGPVPEGKEIDHLCRNRNCVNPEHLEPVTHRENTIRGFDAVLKQRYKRGKNATEGATV